MRDFSYQFFARNLNIGGKCIFLPELMSFNYPPKIWKRRWDDDFLKLKLMKFNYPPTIRPCNDGFFKIDDIELPTQKYKCDTRYQDFLSKAVLTFLQKLIMIGT